MLKKKIEMLPILLDEANKSNHRQHKMAAGIIYKNRLISIAHNSMKSHSFQKKYGRNVDAIYFHAEVHAIYKAIQSGFNNFHKSELIVVRSKWDSSNKNIRKLGLAKPCEGCLSCIKDFNIRKVIYSLDQIELFDLHFGVLENF